MPMNPTDHTVQLAKDLCLSAPLVALDTETTGTSPELDRIIQIGIFKLWPDGSWKEREWLVDPTITIPVEATAIHGISEEQVFGQVPFYRLAPLVVQDLDCDLCGYNIKFDLAMLRSEFKRTNTIFNPGRIVDSFRIFSDKEPRNLSAAIRFFLTPEQIEASFPSGFEAHRALADAKASLEVLRAELKRYPDLPQTIIGLADRYDKPPEGYLDAERRLMWRHGEVAFAFGKHSGKALDKVPIDYLRWIVSSDFSTTVKRYVTDALNGQFHRR